MSEEQATSSSVYFRTKPVERILSEAQEKEGGLKRVLSALDLTAIGVGAIIGAGIFVLTGTAAADHAGPSVMLSFVFAGITCIIAALCYAEFAARLPISGSAYTYSYASVGEIFAWIIGWDLVLEYTIGSSTVAVGWTHYLVNFFETFGINVPLWVSEGVHLAGGGHVNISAGIVVFLLTALLAIGIKESTRFNSGMVIVKLGVVIFVIFAGLGHINPVNYDPFLPYGWNGVFEGAALVFFAYIGFDAVSTAAEEVKNPERDLPIGIISSLVICTLLYIAVSAVITGMVPYIDIDRGAPLAGAFGTVGMGWAKNLISAGAVAGLTTVMLILLMSQPRIYYSMARDGLLPEWFSKVHPKFRTPFNATLLTGVISASIAMFAPMEDLHHMVSIGTLFAFAMVCGSTLITRYKDESQPMKSTYAVLYFALGLILIGLFYHFDYATLVEEVTNEGLMASFSESTYSAFRLIIMGIGGIFALMGMGQLFMMKSVNVPKTFKCPWVPVLPMFGMAANIYLMTQLNLVAWERLFIWLAVGLVIYAFYGASHSKLKSE